MRELDTTAASTAGIPGAPTRSSAKEGRRTWTQAPLLKGSVRHDPQPQMRNIMITGGAGFIGSWMVRHLTLTYCHRYNVVCFDKLDYCASLNNIAHLDKEPNFGFYKGDVTNSSDVMDCLRKYDIDTVLHFAAQSHVDLSFGHSYQFTLTNVFGTQVLLECAKQHGKIRRFIHVSTDEVYGETKVGQDDLVEESPLAPTNPYAASKAAAEMLVHAYSKSFRLPTIVVRSNNVYGPHQFPEKIIPKFTLLLQRRHKLALHGNGRHTRRYLYAGDAADAFDTILHKGEIGQTYNVGSHDEVSNKALCSMLLDLFAIPNRTEADFYRHVEHVEDRPFNDQRYAVDGSKLRKLGWEQKTPFVEGLRATVDWYRKFGGSWWGDVENRLPIGQLPSVSPKDRPRDPSKEGAKSVASKTGSGNVELRRKMQLSLP